VKVWMIYITVTERTAGSPRTLARWLDSQWARESAATQRKQDVELSMRHFGCYRVPGTDVGACCEIIAGTVADAAIATPEAENA
jgi:hypothetical protein